MKVDGSLLVDDPADAGPAAKRLEEAGYDGGFSFEGQHDPFLPLAVAAQQTERPELATAIPLGLARNPMPPANPGPAIRPPPQAPPSPSLRRPVSS